ncbi:Zinc protease PQQL-like [Camellia lanceoleosa]|uniref:Zinc protease PQQL-like n=1 Tax=Camellia lanceoleosa TaxID=1840588 RepID=A0ACC0FL28_9ERIC|nr:Zinc protease PQQL-like [Camellia lanceoleosa]
MKNPVFHVLSCFKSEVSFMPADELKTVKDYRNLLAESMFFHALNQGFLKISRRKDSPYFSCSAATDVVARPVKAYIRTSSCKEKGIIEALKSILTEHFLPNEPVVGVEYEAQLQKSRLPYISASEVSKYVENFRTSCSCVIKIIEPQATATMDDLNTVVSKINSLEDQRSIPRWDDEHIPEEIVNMKPSPGHIVQQFEYSNIGATELILSNGMRVCYRYTDFFDDQMEVVKPLVCTPLAMLAPGGADLERVVFRSSGALTMLNDDVGLKDGSG